MSAHESLGPATDAAARRTLLRLGGDQRLESPGQIGASESPQGLKALPLIPTSGFLSLQHLAEFTPKTPTLRSGWVT